MYLRIMILCLSVAAGMALGQANVQLNSDGSYYTVVQESGDSQAKYDLVFLGDGFTAIEQNLFNKKVEEAVEALKNMTPYSQLMHAFNIRRVNVISNDSGIDQPANKISKDTALDCRYGKGGDSSEPERLITSKSPYKCFEIAGYPPDCDAVVVLVNDALWGGGWFYAALDGISLVFSSVHPNFGQILTHELGHGIGLLSDEYMCLKCDKTDDNRRYDGQEEWFGANIDTSLSHIKWSIAPGTPRPTTPDNSHPDVVGAWVGGGTYSYGIYRPQLMCHMKEHTSPFCVVCDSALRSEIKKRLTSCEINPSTFVCQYLVSQSKFVLNCDKPYIWRWPWPPCYTCPKFDESKIEDEISYVLEGVPREFKLRIIDERGDSVAVGQPFKKWSFKKMFFKKGLKVAFKENRAIQYFVEMTGPQIATEKKLEITVKLRRNGKLEKLP